MRIFSKIQIRKTVDYIIFFSITFNRIFHQPISIIFNFDFLTWTSNQQTYYRSWKLIFNEVSSSFYIWDVMHWLIKRKRISKITLTSSTIHRSRISETLAVAGMGFLFLFISFFKNMFLSIFKILIFFGLYFLTSPFRAYIESIV
jgi:hypothetical protein